MKVMFRARTPRIYGKRKTEERAFYAAIDVVYLENLFREWLSAEGLKELLSRAPVRISPATSIVR